MAEVFIDELLYKTGMDNKYELIRLAIQRTRQLIKEKNKIELVSSKKKFSIIVLREIMEGKLKPEGFKEKKKEK